MSFINLNVLCNNIIVFRVMSFAKLGINKVFADFNEE